MRELLLSKDRTTEELSALLSSLLLGAFLLCCFFLFCHNRSPPSSFCFRLCMFTEHDLFFFQLQNKVLFCILCEFFHTYFYSTRFLKKCKVKKKFVKHIVRTFSKKYMREIIFKRKNRKSFLCLQFFVYNLKNFYFNHWIFPFLAPSKRYVQ